MSINGRRAATKVPEHPGPVSLNMVIGQKNSSTTTTPAAASRTSNDTLSQLEQQVRSIEVNTMAAQRLREELQAGARKPEADSYLRYREHEDLIGTVNHEPERYFQRERYTEREKPIGFMLDYKVVFEVERERITHARETVYVYVCVCL